MIPATWNVPAEAKPVVDETASEPPARFWSAPFTVVVAAPGDTVSTVTVSPSSVTLRT